MSPDAFFDGVGRALPRFAGESLDGSDERRFLSANESARPSHDLDIEVDSGAQDVGAQEPHVACLAKRDGGVLDGERIFAPHVDETSCGADGNASDEQPLDDGVRIAFQQAAVHIGAGITFVGVAHDILLPGAVAGSPGKLPLLARWETGPTPASADPIS